MVVCVNKRRNTKKCFFDSTCNKRDRRTNTQILQGWGCREKGETDLRICLAPAGILAAFSCGIRAQVAVSRNGVLIHWQKKGPGTLLH